MQNRFDKFNYKILSLLFLSQVKLIQGKLDSVRVKRKHFNLLLTRGLTPSKLSSPLFVFFLCK